jgi:hypothetical protein
MPTYADYGGWVISTIAGRFEVTPDTQFGDSSNHSIQVAE